VLLEKLHEQDLIDILLNKTSFKNLVATMVAVSSKTEWNCHEKLLELSKLANKAEEIRNQIVHSLWYSHGRIKKSIKPKEGKVETKFEQYEVDELNNVAATIDKIDSSIDALASKYIEDELAKGKNLPGVQVV
jgi:hypothetical protein